MMRLLVILTFVVFVSCDSSVDMSHSDRSVSVSIQTAQQFYEDYHKRNNKSSDDSIKVVVLDEMVRQYPPDWTQAVAWSDGQGGAYVATLIGADKSAISFSRDSVSVIRTLMADVNSDGTVTGSRLLKFISIDHLDPTQFQRYVKQWILGDYGESTMMVAEFTLGFESQTAQLSLPQDSLKVPVGISLKEVAEYGKVEDESRWCYV